LLFLVVVVVVVVVAYVSCMPCLADVAPVPTISCNVEGKTKATPWACTATFSEAVVGFTASDITVTNGVLSGILLLLPQPSFLLL
jgi:hypothetical protein